ncbi:hypothetical protein GS445_07825 [Rhodococcus hoagii]|uniref:Lipoprotein n=1 Tax=Rhodococcus hoagii TaxID=43767 RepID=A0A9Q4ZKA0_RHOHA|nr:hypothetical protein [Prescottella equi]MBM4492139.1 hypothetical protein [Prescottella equi]MBM4495418.1 hypothetical protein [Prescottella equi]MBM4497658.1 hypothetical protein [Prescottella equi]MBM4549566.1 hypothetical protein [Prescottella equi]MBM4565395.1 hypothetical protein [Prescottella equi]
MKLPLVVVGVALSTIVLSSCGSSSSEPAEQTKVAGNDASVVAQVDCGDDGVANVTVSYGSTKKETLVGRNETTRSAGGVDTFSNQYGTRAGMGDATLAVLTQPTRGTCKTTLTDYNSGNIIGERETAGKAELSVVISPDS